MNNNLCRARSGLNLSCLLSVLFALCVLVVSAPVASASQQLYTCGMHPQVIKTEPGDCPICHMKLTPLLGSGGAAASGGMAGGAAAQLATITIGPGTIQRMNLKTQEVRAEAAEREVRTVGIVAFDERTQRDITTRYDGWIEAMYVNASWQRIKEGEPLFEIYSPALYNAQLNYLMALRSEGEGGGSLTAAALERLLLLGVGEAFIDELKASGKAVRNYVYRSPADGVVVEKLARQGQMINAGQPIYSVASLSPVWVLAQVYERDLPLVHAGQPVRVRSSYGQSPIALEGTVAEVLPQVQDATRAAVARIVLENPGEALLPGMFTDVRFVADLGDSALLVPDEAVLRSGEKNTVFVALGEGRFEPREVVLGPRTNDHRYVVKEGLESGETVVVSGQFMLDSESRLREAIAKMVSAATGESGGMSTEAAAHLAAGHNHGAAGSATGKAASANAAGSDRHAKAAGAHAHGNLAHTTAMATDHSCCATDALAGNAQQAIPQSGGTSVNAADSAAGDHAHTVDVSGHNHTVHTQHDGHNHSAHVQHEGHNHTAHAQHGGQNQAAPADACCGGVSAVAPASPEQVQAAQERRNQMRRSPLVVLAFAAADASTALARDDFAAYREQLPALNAVLQAYVKDAKIAANDPLAVALKNTAFTAPRNIAQAREAFAPFSNRLAEVIAQSGLNKSGVIHIFECPMVPKVGTGRWLQREDGAAWNPYFGAEMLHCGGIVE